MESVVFPDPEFGAVRQNAENMILFLIAVFVHVSSGFIEVFSVKLRSFAADNDEGGHIDFIKRKLLKRAYPFCFRFTSGIFHISAQCAFSAFRNENFNRFMEQFPAFFSCGIIKADRQGAFCRGKQILQNFFFGNKQIGKADEAKTVLQRRAEACCGNIGGGYARMNPYVYILKFRRILSMFF